jgi:putative ABC transport system permease protein
MFILRQISSKLSSTFISMTIISLMLLIAIATMSAGLGFSKTLTAKNEKLLPCDGTIIFENTSKQSKKVSSQSANTMDYMNQKGLDLSKNIKGSSQFNLYSTKAIKYGDLLTAEDKEGVYGDFGDMAVSVMKLSDFNNQRKFLGQEPITLKDNEFTILSTVNVANDMFKNSMVEKVQAKMFGKTFTPVGKLIEDSLEVEMVGQTIGWVILPDQYVTDSDFKKDYTYLNYNYKDSGVNKEKADSKLYLDIEKKVWKAKDSKEDKAKQQIDLYSMLSKETVRTAQVGIKTIASFFIIYIGIIFLISCAAILALQQLSESTDNAERYKLLRKLGVEEKMMKHSLLAQMAIYFLVPLTVAIVHSAVAIRFSTKLLKLFGETGVAMNTLFVAAFVVLIYGGYFIATYIAGKGIIRES